jgi:hypothetical protein
MLRQAVAITNDEEADKIITQVISTGVIQNVYRNASKEQKVKTLINLGGNLSVS